MSDLSERWNAQERARFMQPNWQRWLRPDADRFVRPDAERHLKPDWQDRRYWAVPPEVFPSEIIEPWRTTKAEPPALSAEVIALLRLEQAQIRWMLSDLKLHLALKRLARKAYNPDQPRVPAGNSDGGQWTNVGGVGAAQGAIVTQEPIRLAGPVPTNEPPEVPKVRPPTAEERNGYIKSIARWLGKYGGPLGRIVAAGHWLYEYDKLIEANLDGPRRLEELQDAASEPRPGYQRHHIVEQTHAAQDGYPRELIDGRDNVVRIPTLKHREITGWYQTKNDDFGGLSPREYLRGKSWEERRRIGLDALFDHGVLDR